MFNIINLRGNYTKDVLLHNNINFNYVINGYPSINLLDYENIKFTNKINLNINDKILFYLPRKNQENIKFVNNIFKFKLDYIEQDIKILVM